jgi:predicted RNA-binding protein YlqC (UPF0109 family)
MDARFIREIVDQPDDHRVTDVESKGRAWDHSVKDLRVRHDAAADIDGRLRGD